MVLLKRAIEQIKNKKVKSLLLLCSFFVIGNFIIIMYSVQTNVDDTKDIIRNQMPAVIEYSANSEEHYNYYKAKCYEEKLSDFDCGELMWDSQGKELSISFDEIKPLIEDNRVLAINAKNYISLSSATLDAISTPENSSVGDEFQLIGNAYPAMIEFNNGNYKITSGRFYAQDEINNFSSVALVTNRLAELNNIQVGDKVIFGDIVAATNGGDLNTPLTSESLLSEQYHLELEIIGLYENNSEEFDTINLSSNSKAPFMNKDNAILIPATTLEYYSRSKTLLDLESDYLSGALIEGKPWTKEEYLTATSWYDLDSETIMDKVRIANYYLLKNPDDVDQFLKDYDYLNTNFKHLYANDAQYQRMKTPLDILGQISSATTLIVFIISALFVTLITSFNFKLREYEFGLQLSLGVTKLRILLQFFIEILIIATLGFLLSLGSSRVIANQVDQIIINYMVYESDKVSIEESDNTYNWQDTTNYFKEVDTLTFFENYQSQWNLPMILTMYLLILLVIFISGIIPIITLMRRSPKNILMNRE